MNKNIILWLLKSLLFSLIFLFVFNIIGQYINMNIPVNIWSILVIGILKLPGICMLLVLDLIIDK